MPSKLKHKKLNVQEEKCVAAWIENHGHNRNATLVGYPSHKKWNVNSQDTFATKFFKRPHIAHRIKDIEHKVAKKTEISAEWVLKRIVKNIDRCMQEVPVLNTDGSHKLIAGPDGNLVAMFEHNATAANQGLGMLMKHKGLYELDNRQRDSLTRQIGKMDLDKLEDMAKHLKKLLAK